MRPPLSSFSEQSRKPSKATIRKTLARAREAWDDLERHLAETYGLKGALHFMYGQPYGWALRFLRGGRPVLAMYPNKNRFTVQVVLGPTQVSTAMEMGLPSRVMKVLLAAKPWPEGRWLFIRVKSLRGARELRPLIALKLSRPSSHGARVRPKRSA